MRLIYTCSSCKKQNYFKPKMDSRADLQRKFGDEVQVNCNNCGKLEKKHLNRISAQVDNRLVVMGFVLGLLLVMFLIFFTQSAATDYSSGWKFLAVSGTTIAALPMYLWNRENKIVRVFNSYAIKKKSI